LNIREVIEQLMSKAESLPDGVGTEVRLVMCNGTDAEITRIFEIDHMAVVSKADDSVTDAFVIVKGHPHLDETSTVLRGVAEDVDDHLRRWTEDDSPQDPAH
jgi:hypothetical protein